MSHSILTQLSPGDVCSAPFAHATLEDVFETALYRSLAEEFPPLQRFTASLPAVASNQAVRIPARDIVGNPEFSREWQDFFAYHTSPDFWDELVRVFGDAIRATHPHLEKRAGKRLTDWRVTRRGSGKEGDVALDALFVVNTPVTRKGSVRPAHVDSEKEIWAGLLYMRAPEETGAGGDLALYSFKDKPAFGGHYAPLSAVNEDKLIAYRANQLVAFVNSAKSIHGVTPREPTPHHRRYINFVAITPFKAFSLPMMSPWAQFRFWLERRKTKARGVLARPSSQRSPR
ncbi:MAG: hypothetical protein JNM20_13505 [Rhizobiales bacterium]|nr:hypothetical protein [Hyphomicrobiales bacterium]